MVPHTLVLEHVSPATRLLEKRRQMFEVQEALEQQKQEFNNKVIFHVLWQSRLPHHLVRCCGKLGVSVSQLYAVCAAA